MAAPTTPFIVYYEGAVIPAATLYAYTLADSSITFEGYRVLCRDLSAGASAVVNVFKNSTLLYQITVNSNDTHDQSLPRIGFNPGDVFSLVIDSVTGSLDGLTFTFATDVVAGVTPEFLALQIQTPLITRYEGELEVGDTFFTYTASQRLNLFGYGLALRNTADANVTIGLLIDSVQVAVLSLGANQTLSQSTLDLVVNTGSSIALQILTVGSPANPGESLIGYLNFRNMDQTEFSFYQNPFVLEYEALVTAQSNHIFDYTAPRDFTVLLLQAYTRETSSTPQVIGLYKNGSLVQTATIAANENHSPVSSTSVFSLSVLAGDLLSLQFVSGTQAAGVVVTLDYYLTPAEQTQNFVYYSDPDSDIILLARQLGIGGKQADALNLEKLQKYKQDVDNILNSRMSALYRTPFVKTFAAGVSPWPNPIQFIAQRLVLRYLLADVYSEVEPNASSNIATQATIAEEHLKRILSREFLLLGQKLRSRNYGSNPYTEPLFIQTTYLNTPPTGSEQQS